MIVTATQRCVPRGAVGPVGRGFCYFFVLPNEGRGDFFPLRGGSQPVSGGSVFEDPFAAECIGSVTRSMREEMPCDYQVWAMDDA